MRTDLIPERPEYYVQTGSMFENPYGVPHDEIVSMLLELPTEVAAQVIFGKYVESSGIVFSGELIQNMIDRSIPRVTGDRWQDDAVVQQARLWPYHAKMGSFAIGIDYARQTDYTVISVIDCRVRPAPLVYYRRLNRVPWESIYREVGRALSIFGPSALGDATGPQGDVIFDAQESRLYCPKHDRTIFLGTGEVCIDARGDRLAGCGVDDYVPLSAVSPFQFTQNRKRELIEHLRNVLSVGYRARSEEEFGWLRTPPIVQLEEEMSFYAWDDKHMETDCLMSLALAVWEGLEDVVGTAHVGSPYGG